MQDDFLKDNLLVFGKSIFLSKLRLLFFGQILEITTPAGAEIYVPTPELADYRLGLLVVISPEFTIFASHNSRFF